MKKQIRIFLDARAMDVLTFGVARYVHEMISRLPTLKPEWEWYVLRCGKPSTIRKGNIVTIKRPVPVDDYPEEQRQLKLLDQEFEPDIIHSLWFSTAEVFKCIRLLSIQDTIALKQFPEYTVSPLLERVPWYRRSAYAADHIITPSHTSKRDIYIMYKKDPEKISVIPHGCSETFRKPSTSEIKRVRNKYKLPDQYIFCSAHYNISYKNMNVIIQARKLLQSSKSNIPHFVSTGFQEEARSDKWIRLSLVPEKDMPAILAGSLFMVYPSMDEGFGLPLLEAMACEIPVISSNAASLPEASGGNALFFDPHNPSTLADSITLLLKSEKTRNDLIKKGMAYATSMTWETTARAHISLYEDALNKKINCTRVIENNIDWNEIEKEDIIISKNGVPQIVQK